jgi:hypothetical protein
MFHPYSIFALPHSMGVRFLDLAYLGVPTVKDVRHDMSSVFAVWCKESRRALSAMRACVHGKQRIQDISHTMTSPRFNLRICYGRFFSVVLYCMISGVCAFEDADLEDGVWEQIVLASMQWRGLRARRLALRDDPAWPELVRKLRCKAVVIAAHVMRAV